MPDVFNPPPLGVVVENPSTQTLTFTTGGGGMGGGGTTTFISTR